MTTRTAIPQDIQDLLSEQLPGPALRKFRGAVEEAVFRVLDWRDGLTLAVPCETDLQVAVVAQAGAMLRKHLRGAGGPPRSSWMPWGSKVIHANNDGWSPARDIQ